MLDRLEAFLVTALGKGVIRAKDTPNFIANRIGVFSIVATMLHTERFGLPYDVVDALTGPAIGRPKSASFRTVDVVGLDTTAHVIGTMRDTLAGDPWHAHFAVPPVLAALVAKGALGQKAGAGYYRKQGRTIEVLDPASASYRPSAGEVAPEVAEILKVRAIGEKLAKLRACPHPQAQFLWAVFRDVFHYAAFHLASIADNARDVDLAIRWGFGWKQGPFETWQAAGWSQVAGWIAEDLAAGRTLANAPLPPWVDGQRVRAAGGVHTAQGSYAPAADAFHGRSTLPVYERQLLPGRRARRALRPRREGLRDRGRAHVAPRRRRRGRVVPHQEAHGERRRARRPAARLRRGRARLRRAGDLAAGGAVLARRGPVGHRARGGRGGSGTASKAW